ncbi:hypothetical protein ED733_004325 [Metarhizium rileyi]|uniref:Uncharacterized protein n=1 Tax=Metarhizium rileyi (strain RCEF 4871) TaxID=1649241 RepID=A0A5C6GB65_METRR|nr:hypothetical protein ED733_004325 [Metarhizium rileyi]
MADTAAKLTPLRHEQQPLCGSKATISHGRLRYLRESRVTSAFLASNDVEAWPKLRLMHIADTLHMRYSRKGDIKSNILATRASEKCRDIFRAACRIDGVSLDKSPALVEGNSVRWSRSSMPLGLSACKEEFNVRFGELPVAQGHLRKLQLSHVGLDSKNVYEGEDSSS